MHGHDDILKIIKYYATNNQLGDNCIKNFHLGRYIVGYTVGNLVLRRRASGAVKRDFRTYIWRYTSPNENVEYGYPHSNVLLQFEHKAARHPTKCDVINEVKLFQIAGYTVASFWRYQIRRHVKTQVHMICADPFIQHAITVIYVTYFQMYYYLMQ